MPFEAWQPPSDNALILRTIARRIGSLRQAATAEKNRLHAAEFLAAASPVIQRDIIVNLRHLERRMRSLSRHAIAIVRSDEELVRKFKLLVTVKGIAQVSAIRILGELEVLPGDMTPRQWVAHGGLDPRHHDSGTSVNKPARISKVGNERLRAALFMPALVATRHEPCIRAYSEALQARGKKPLQAVTAVMRRLLHSIHAMFRLDVPFDPQKFTRPLAFQESA
jgi:transposase